MIVLFRTTSESGAEFARSYCIRARTDNYSVLVTSDQKCQTLERDDREPLHRSRKTNITNGITACPFPDRHLGPADWLTTVRIASQLRTRGRCLDFTVNIRILPLSEREDSFSYVTYFQLLPSRVRCYRTKLC